MRALVIILLSLLSLGFEIVTPEMQRQREREEQAWHTELAAHYDLAALRAFLVREIAARPEVEGVALAKARLEKEWIPAGHSSKCGDWMFLAVPPSAEQFTLMWTYQRMGMTNGKELHRIVILHCRRLAKASFAVERVERKDEEMFILIP